MSVLAFLMRRIDSVGQTLFIIATIFFVSGISLSILAIVFDLKAFRMERSLGKQGMWYKRPTIVNGTGSILLSISSLLLIGISVKILPFMLSLYIVIFGLIAVAFVLISYTFVLNARKRRKL